MEIGQKVKVKLAKGFLFTGIYSDNIPNSENILIQGEKMGLIVSKSDCALAEHSGVPQANELLPHVSGMFCTYELSCTAKGKNCECNAHTECSWQNYR
jgi:hypothetical protein